MSDNEGLALIRESLIKGIETLTATQVKIVDAVVDALKVPTTFLPGPSSDLVDEAFVETMANFLVLHHSLHEEPLSKKPFEYIFKQCLIAQGRPAELNATPGQHPYDVLGGGLRWSLKTEAAKGISSSQIKIEKLMEARWIRECQTEEACAAEVRGRLPRHLAGYDRILILRAFVRGGEKVYHLEEVPVNVLNHCFSSASPDMFSKSPRSPSFGANFRYPGHHTRTFRILLDSSVEKVRLWYASEHCRRHGTWIIPDDREISLDL